MDDIENNLGMAHTTVAKYGPAVLLGGGPSLVDDLILVHIACPEASVFAVNHWYQRIDPPIQPKAVFFKDRNCWPILRNGLTGEGVICPFPELASKALYQHIEPASPNVRTAIDAARWLTDRGYGPIYLCGMDCSSSHYGDEEIIEPTEFEQFEMVHEWQTNLDHEVKDNLVAVSGPLTEYFYV